MELPKKYPISFDRKKRCPISRIIVWGKITSSAASFLDASESAISRLETTVAGMADAMRINGTRVSVPDPDLRYKVSQIFAHLVKLAVDSVVDGSRTLIPGKKHAHRTVQEGSMDVPLPTSLKANKIPDFIKGAKNHPFQMKMQEVEEHVSNLKQRYETSPKCADGSEPPKKPSDDLKTVDIMKKNGRRVFIRSRL